MGKGKIKSIIRKARLKKIMQTGSSDLARDKMRKAKKVGWRVSKSGKKYFENRKNRSDVNA